MSDSPPLLVTIGADHHPFDRLIRWVDYWLEHSRPAELRCLMQIGMSAPPDRQLAPLPAHEDLQAAWQERPQWSATAGPGRPSARSTWA